LITWWLTSAAVKQGLTKGNIPVISKVVVVYYREQQCLTPFSAPLEVFLSIHFYHLGFQKIKAMNHTNQLRDESHHYKL